MKPSHEHYKAVIFAEVKDSGPFQEHIVASDGDFVFGRQSLPKFGAFTAFQRKDIHPDVFNLLRAAPLMYSTLTEVFVNLQTLLDYFDQMQVSDDSPVRGLLDNAQTQIIMAQSAARDGVEAVVKQINAEKQLKGK